MPFRLVSRFFFLCFLMIIAMSACRSRALSMQSPINRQLIFGSGGGFSGQVITFTLLENGALSRTNSLSKENKVLNPIPKKDARHFFEQADQLKFGSLDFKHPGNMYYFIRLIKGDRQQEIIWGDINYPVPAQVQVLYESLEKASSQ